MLQLVFERLRSKKIRDQFKATKNRVGPKSSLLISELNTCLNIIRPLISSFLFIPKLGVPLPPATGQSKTRSSLAGIRALLILLPAPTGSAVVDRRGVGIHSDFSIPSWGTLLPLARK